MIDRKKIIFYFVRRIKNNLPREEKRKLDGYRIIVDENTFVPYRGGSLKGSCSGRRKTIVFYLSQIPDTFDDLEGGLKRIESLVEHEILHAIGIGDEEIQKKRENKGGEV